MDPRNFKIIVSLERFLFIYNYFVMRIIKIFILIATGLFLNNCVNKSHTGAVLGGATATTMCLEYIGDNPTLIATCAVGGAFAGAEALYNSDYDKHNAVFVDHLNNSPNGSSYTNWYNPRNGNNGIIKTTGFYLKGPIKCTMVETTHDQNLNNTRFFDSILYGNPYRKMQWHEACKMPDGRWMLTQ